MIFFLVFYIVIKFVKNVLSFCKISHFLQMANYFRSILFRVTAGSLPTKPKAETLSLFSLFLSLSPSSSLPFLCRDSAFIFGRIATNILAEMLQKCNRNALQFLRQLIPPSSLDFTLYTLHSFFGQFFISFTFRFWTSFPHSLPPLPCLLSQHF